MQLASRHSHHCRHAAPPTRLAARATLALALALQIAAADAAIPSNQPPLELVVTTPTQSYNLRRGLSGTPDFMPSVQMFNAANALDRSGTASPGNPLGYHAGYVGRGFREPWFLGGTKDVVFWACANGDPFDCDNGFATAEQIIMPTEVYAGRSESCVRGILGHELFHHVEFGYVIDGGGSGCAGGFGSTACEGHARALQDKIYFDLDLDPAASCVATFRGEVDGYLKNPDRTIWSSSYRSALFWTYLMEQYGSYRVEPGLGVDFLKNWWELAQTRMSDPSIVDVTNEVIQQYQPGDNVTNAYHDFTIANLLKDLDLSQVGESFRLRYSYRDEEPVPLRNNLMQFGPVTISQTLSVPSNGTAASAAITAKRFGGRYIAFDTSSCPAGSTLQFTATPTALIPLNANAQLILPDALHALVAIEGTAPGKPRKLYKWRAQSWKQLLVQPSARYDRIVAIMSGWHSDYAGTLALRCLAPPPLPLVAGLGTGTPLVTGTPGTASLAQFSVQVSEPGGGGFDTLDLDDLAVVADPGGVALLLPAVQKVREAAARIRVSVATPNLPAGMYTAQIRAAGRSIDIPGGLRVGAHQPEVLVAIDSTASMGQPSVAPRLQTATLAARLVGQALPSDARLGLLRVAGSTGSAAANATQLTPLATLNSAQRSQWLSDLAALTPGTASTIKLEDVLISSLSAYTAQGNGGERHLLLITDSGNGIATSADALATQARDAGIRVHVLALGTQADQPLYARLASQTGGSYHWAAVGATGVDRSTLTTALDQIVNRITRRQGAASASASTGVGSPAVINITMPQSSASTPHVKVFDGVSATPLSAVRLYRPDLSQVTSGAGVEIYQDDRSFAFHVSNAPAGNWRLEVDPSGAGGPIAFDYAAAVTQPQDSLQLGFARASGDNEAVEYFRIGEPVLIQAALTQLGAASAPATASATLTKVGAGTLVLSLRDDGSQGDQFAGDRIYSALYRATDQGSLTGVIDTEGAAGSAGSVQVRAEINIGTPAAPQLLVARGSFSVQREAVVADADNDGLPDRYESRQVCLDPASADASSDRDGDGASNAAEYAAGSDPCDVDSDDGGETDGSELLAGRRPLDAGDDGIRRIRELEIVTQLPDHEELPPLPPLAHTLRFDSDPGYTQVVVRRATSVQGPYQLIATVDAASANGRYVDTGLVAGQNYCYQLEARNGTRTAAASDLVCGIARSDSTAPRGSVILNRGDARSSNPLLVAAIAVDHESSAGMQMRLTLPDGSDTGWVAYSPFYAVNASSLGLPAVATVGLQLRDAAGNESIEYGDDIDLVAPGTVGGISGQVRVDASLGDPDLPLTGVSVRPDADTEAGTLSLAGGSFALVDLPPGSYTLSFELPGYQTRFVANVVVSGGAVQNLGTIRLLPQPLFRDGFEN
ncbi:MAG: carboxypeptidase regulatory-like domain-containing protein [Lysobacterales bacterium]